MKTFSFVVLILLSNAVFAHEHASHQSAEFTKCPEVRSQMCTREYRPVCASVEVQCVTTPCHPVKRTYANGCEACADEQVLGYVPKACEELESQSGEGIY